MYAGGFPPWASVLLSIKWEKVGDDEHKEPFHPLTPGATRLDSFTPSRFLPHW